MLLTICFSSISAFSQESLSGLSACAVHIEGDFNVKEKIEETGCKKGDALLMFNEAVTRRWQSLIPIRAAAVVVCDMDKPITDSQDQGLQYVMCTFSGEFRSLQIKDEYKKGWLWF